MMARLTEDDLESLANHKDASGKPLTTDHYKCLIPSTEPNHQKYVKIGANTGNINKHASLHQPVMDALERLISETSAAECLQVQCWLC